MTQLSEYVPGKINNLLSKIKTKTKFTYINIALGIIDTEKCFLYEGKINDSGYGVFRDRRVHIISWIIHNNKLPKNFILHKCDIRNCWNPNHLFEGTAFDNVQDAISKGRMKLWSTNHGGALKEKRKTNCDKGHPLDGLRSNGKRYCLSCNRERVKRYR
jgi:hypothetical protein